MSMAVWKIRFLLHTVFIEVLFFDLAEHFSGPVLNISTPDHILKTGDNFTVLCEGNGRLKWDIEDVEDDGLYSKYTTIEIVNSTSRSDKFTSAIEMRITNVTFPYVGIYYCLNEEDTSSAAATVYLYVNDEKFLAATDVMFNHFEVIKQGDTVTLPCIPASPDVEVTLVKEIENQHPKTIEIGINNEGKYYMFSQFSGFETDDTDQIQLLTYRCEFKRGNLTLSYPVHVDVEPETYSIAEPKIEEIYSKEYNSRPRYIAGETIALKCSVKSHVRIDFLWTVDQDIGDKLIQIKGKSETDPQNPDFMYAILTIRNISSKDIGTYTCQVSDYQGHNSENKIDITVVEHLWIKLIGRGCSVEKYGNVQSVNCSVQINAHPLPNVTWLNNKNESIRSENVQYVKEINSTSMIASLKIENVRAKDVGIYTLMTANEYDMVNFTYLVDVIKNPSIDLKLDAEFQMVDEEITVECIVTSYPEPSVLLMYKPCFDDSCDYTALEDVDSDKTENYLSASVRTSFEDSGLIKCIVTQSIMGGSDDETFEKEIQLFISDVENGFAIKTQDGLESNEDYNVVVITIENSIQLKCSAYIRNFTQKIKWKRDSKEIISNDKYKITTDSTGFSILSILNISDLDSEDAGIYRCELYKVFGDNEELTKTLSLAVTMFAHIAPILIDTNLNSTIEITDCSHLELTCIFKGAPKPNITWYKNNERITTSSTRISNADGRKITFNSTTKEDEGNYKCEEKNTWGTRKKETKFVYKFSDLAEHSSGPVLNISTYDHILKTGDNFTVLCEGNGRLKWDIEDVKDGGLYSKYTMIEFVDWTPRSDKFTKAIEMRIINVTFPYVGMYYCLDEEDSSIFI